MTMIIEKRQTYEVKNPASNTPTIILHTRRPPKLFTAAVAADAVPKHTIMPERLYFAEIALVMRPDGGPKSKIGRAHV